MDKKMILAGIPVVALLLTIIAPLVSVFGFGASLFDLFKSGGNVILGLLFIIIPLGTAYAAWSNQFLNIAAWLMLLPAIWLLIWCEFHFMGAGLWLYLILAIAEIVLVMKPDLLDGMCAKKE